MDDVWLARHQEASGEPGGQLSASAMTNGGVVLIPESQRKEGGRHGKEVRMADLEEQMAQNEFQEQDEAYSVMGNSGFFCFERPLVYLSLLPCTQPGSLPGPRNCLGSVTSVMEY
jgi:hypothetical protein